MANKENLPPTSPRPLVSSISPSNKPALSRQRDHSACRRPDTPLKVRKTRENLKQHSIFGDIPPPCLHTPHKNSPRESYDISLSDRSVLAGNYVVYDSTNSFHNILTHQAVPQKGNTSQSALASVQVPSTTTGVQRRKSASRRIFSMVKQGIGRSKAVHSIHPAESETSLMRRLSGRRRLSTETEQRAHSFEISRASIDSCVDEPSGSLKSVSSTARSFTGSTVSAADVFGDVSAHDIPHLSADYFGKPMVLDLSHACGSSPSRSSSPTTHQTPKPPKRMSVAIPEEVYRPTDVTVPSTELEVAQDCDTLDIHAKRNVWIAIKATVKANTANIQKPMRGDITMPNAPTYLALNTFRTEEGPCQDQLCGAVTMLRLSFKALGGCRIRDIVGRKTFKDLSIGQQCNLFVRLHVPKIKSRINENEPDQDSLLTELESIVGTLQTEILYVEARYRHSMLPSDNVVTVRHVCKIQRPKTESRWSMIDVRQMATPSTDAQKRLARYIAYVYPPNRALELMQEYLDDDAGRTLEIQELRKSLAFKCDQWKRSSKDDSKPSVVITDIDWNSTAPLVDMPEQFSTPPTTPAELAEEPSRGQPTAYNASHRRQSSSISLFSPITLAPPLLSAPKTTTALSVSASQSSNNLGTGIEHSPGSQDTARKLWRHIRRTSLSTKQLEDITPDRLQSLEAGDETLKDMRRRALANKRSIGAETLRGWKWEESKRNQDNLGEAPWM